MTRLLIVTMDGGGNLPPALGIAREVERRGGSARFLGNEAQRASVEAEGLRFEAFREGRDYVSSAPRSTVGAIADLTGLFADRGIGRDAIASIAAEPVDLVLVDCLLWGATIEIAAAGIPVVSLVHSQWQYFRGNARGPVGVIARMRGANPLAAESAVLGTVVTTRPEFEDDRGVASPAGVAHTGFVWQGIPVERTDTTPPRVLVSFSTTSFPGQAAALQRVLGALGDLPVEVTMTTGAVDPASLRVPSNARVERRIDHAQLLPTTRLVIGHGGHATTSRALAHGIPVLVMPMHPLMDQPAIGRAVERLGLGRVIPKSSSPQVIRAAASALLADESVDAAARAIGTRIRARDGAVTAVDELERLHAGQRRDATIAD